MYATGTLSNYKSSDLGSLDIISQLPKLTVKEIEYLLKTKFKNSSVVSASDAQSIYNAQQSTGISALATLGIGGLESGWGTSNIAKTSNNLWGYGATNDNPAGNAHKYSAEEAFTKFSEEFKSTYYNKYGAKTINSVGTGNNPAGKGYAYNDNGTINSSWATNVSSIMSKMVTSLLDANYSDISEDTATIASSTEAIATDTSTIAKVDFKSELESLINSGTTVDPEKKTSYQGDLLQYIKDNVKTSDDIDKGILTSWEALQKYQKDNEKTFDEYRKKLADNRWSDSYDELHDDISGEAMEYTESIMQASVDSELSAILKKY